MSDTALQPPQGESPVQTLARLLEEAGAIPVICGIPCTGTPEERSVAMIHRIAALEAENAGLEELRLSVLSVGSDEGIYDGEDPESALDCIRANLDGYSRLMWRIQRLCSADSACPDDVEAGITALRERLAAAEREAEESQERLAMAVEALEKIHKGACLTAQESRSRDDDRYCIGDVIQVSRNALAAAAASVAQHTAEVERRGAAKELRRISQTSIHTITLYPNASGPGREYRLVLCEALEARAAELEGA